MLRPRARLAALLALATLAAPLAVTETRGGDRDAAAAPFSRGLPPKAPRSLTARRPKAPGLLASARIDPRAAGRRIPRSFLGFSVEYPFVPLYAGGPATGSNTVFAQLARNLSRARSGPPVLRVGGGSTDDSWWNPDGRPRPPGITYDIDRDWVAGLNDYHASTRSPLILGLNLAQNNPSIAAEWARAAQAGLPKGAVRSFEIGNEPDIFDNRPYGRDARGRTRTARPSPYSFHRYLREFRRHILRLRRLRPLPALAGPTACCEDLWQRGLVKFLRAFGGGLDLVTYHGYPLHACREPSDPSYPTIPILLQDDIVTGFGERYRRLVARAGRFRRPVRITETNSVACGGAEGVSNSFASALWGVDWMFQLASVGVRGADFTSVGPRYAPFTFDYRSTSGFSAAVHPLYYGMLLFSRATAGRARLVRAVFSPNVYFRSLANVKVWATVDRRGTVRAVILNKDGRSGKVKLQVPGGRARASLTRMLAPSISSTTGVTLAGQSFDEPTSSGRLRGAPTSVRVRRGRSDTYRMRMPSGSAALLTVARRPR